MPAYKVASFDISNYELIKKISKTNKKVIVSTGMANEKEIINATIFKKKKHFTPLRFFISNKEADSYLSNIRY